MEGLFFEITILVGIAALLSMLFRLFKQPEILAYILAGFILGPLGIIHLHHTTDLQSLSEIGITLVLFMLGLELRFSELKSVGRVAIITGLGQIGFTTAAGFGIATLLGFAPLPALYIAIALCFSSTIIIVKLLSDKKDLNSLYGKISVGILLVQDFVAILALVVLTAFTQGGSVEPITFVFLFGKLIGLVTVIILLSRFVFPALIDRLARSREVLFLFSIAWAFGLAWLVSSPWIGFSIEIGGFLAGLALANSTSSFQIVTKIRSLRDFFITIFFVMLGMSLTLSTIASYWQPAIILALFVLVGNPLIMMIILGALGYRKRTAFLSGLTVAQVSEFSLIVLVMGQKVGHVSPEIVSLVTLVGVVTFVISSYLILRGNKVYELLQPYLNVFERQHLVEEIEFETHPWNKHIVIVGAHRMGGNMLKMLHAKRSEVLVIDFDPDIVKDLRQKGWKVILGDITDHEVAEAAHLDKAQLLVLTIPDREDNIITTVAAKKINPDLFVLAHAGTEQEKEDLLNAGVDFVLMTYQLSGERIGRIIRKGTWTKLTA